MKNYTIQQKLIPINKYTRPGAKLQRVSGICIHWTSNQNEGADDVAHYRYFSGHAIASQTYASAHYFVDHDSALQIIPDGEMAYHVGARNYRTQRLGKYPNDCTIGVETCVNYKGAKFDAALDRSAWLCAMLLKKHGLGIDDLYRHYDVTGKDCPKYFVTDSTARDFGFKDADTAWSGFKATVKRYMSATPAPQKPAAKPKPTTPPVQPAGQIGIGRAEIVASSLNLRDKPSLSGKVLKTLKGGSNYNVYEIKGDWYRLSGTGWASAGSKGDLLRYTPHPKPSAPDRVKVVYKGREGVAVRAEADFSAPAEQYVKYGEVFTVDSIVKSRQGTNMYKLKSGLYVTAVDSYLKPI